MEVALLQIVGFAQLAACHHLCQRFPLDGGLEANLVEVATGGSGHHFIDFVLVKSCGSKVDGGIVGVVAGVIDNSTIGDVIIVAHCDLGDREGGGVVRVATC